MDPASPWFEQTKEEHRVSKSDAEFVDVIHTNSGLLVTVISMYITFIAWFNKNLVLFTLTSHIYNTSNFRVDFHSWKIWVILISTQMVADTSQDVLIYAAHSKTFVFLEAPYLDHLSIG